MRGKHVKKGRRKAAHAKKSTINDKLKNILKYRRILVVLLSMFIIAITIMPTYAYFIGKGDWNSLNSGLNDLTINNGSVNFDVDYSSAVWKKSNNSAMTSYSNPNTDEIATYGPIWVRQISNYKLTSKVDLLTEYEVDKDGGSDEVLDLGKNLIEESTIEEPFEVILGDIDNFGYTEKGDPYLDASAKHSMDVFPGRYDGKGTDRRMVGSGFYNALKKYNNGITYGFNHNVYYDLSGNGHDGIAGNNDMPCYGYKSYNYYSYTDLNGDTKTNNYFLYDGYTDWAIRGIAGTNGEKDASDCVIDNKNWKWLQEVEPLTFKYDTISKDIKTVIFQIFTDDIQSDYATTGEMGVFQSKSGSKYHVYLNGTEIEEFTDKINDYAQSGPKGNIINLELPSKYFDIIKSSSGLDGDGLKLLIDDKNGINARDYYTGDSFVIDFAKMTVNAPATGSEEDKYYGSVSGKVIDKYKKEVEGVKIIAETGESVLTDENGRFKFDKLYKGLNKFTAIKDGYKKNIFYIDTGKSNDNIVMEYSDIVMQEKCEVDVIVTKCNLRGEELKDSYGNVIQMIKKSTELNNDSYYIRKSGTIVNESFNIDFQPDAMYKIEYKLKLKSHNDLKDMQDFKLNFTVNSIKIKATQENNIGWGITGTSEKYTDNYNNVEYNNSLPNNSSVDTNENEDKNTKIYFNVPDTGYYNTISQTDFYLNGTKLEDSDGTKKSLYSDSWWLFDFKEYNKILSNINSNKGSKIQVKNSSVTDADSGELYWFTTQKVFICTN